MLVFGYYNYVTILTMYEECRAGNEADNQVIFTSLPQNVLQAPHSLGKTVMQL